MPLRLSLGVLLITTLLLLAGCSGIGDRPAAAPTPTGSPTPSPGPTPTLDNFGENGTLEVHFIDVGQGSATLLVGPTNETMLIDSGNWQDDGESVIDYLQRENITRIDYLVTSHADADHIGGHAAIIEHVETEGDGVGAVYDPGIAASTQTYDEYLDAVEEHDVTLYQARTGDHIPFEGVRVDVLAPPQDALADRDRNENSLVLQVTYGDSSFLFPGDAAEAEETYLLQQFGEGLASTVLQASHHGSRASSSGELLDAVSPSAVVVSSDYDSRYGHPHNETLERFAARDVTTFWTGIHGSILLVSDGSDIALFSQTEATTDPLALRSAPAYSAGVDGEMVLRGVIEVARPTESTATTDGGTQTPATDNGNPATDGSLTIAEIHADANGDDRGNLNDEYVVFTNAGDTTFELTGWTVTDEAGHRYTFPDGYSLDGGESVTLHSGMGTDVPSDLYWGSYRPVWNNDGDTVTVFDSEGERVLEESY